MRKILFFSFLLSLPLTCFAHGFNYNYVEGGGHSETMAITQSGKRSNGYGGYLSGSWQFTDSAYLFSNITYATKNYHLDTADTTNHVKSSTALPEIGLGLHRSMGNVDLLTEASYVLSSWKLNQDGASRDGHLVYSDHESSAMSVFRLLVGMRAHLLPQMDGWLKAGYMDGGKDYDNHFFGVLGSQYHFNDMWSLVAQVELDHQSTHWNIGARVQF